MILDIFSLMLFGFVSIFSVLCVGYALASYDMKTTIKRMKKISVNDSEIVAYLLNEK